MSFFFYITAKRRRAVDLRSISHPCGKTAWMGHTAFIAMLAVVGLPVGAVAQQESARVAATAVMVQPDVSAGQARAAEKAYMAGAKKFERSDLAGAAADFDRAMTLNPTKADYRMAAELVKQRRVNKMVQDAARLRLSGKIAEADALLADAAKIDPESALLTQRAGAAVRQDSDVKPWIEQQPPQFAAPIALKPTAERRSFHVRADAAELMRQIAQAYGLKAVMDSNVTAQSIRLDLDDVTFDEALRITTMMAHMFTVALDEKTMLVAHDAADARERLERLVEETIYLPGVTNESLNDLTNVLRNVFELKQVTLQAGNSSVLLRAPADQMPAINAVMEDLIDSTAEVVLELKLYEVDSTKLRRIGAQLPQSVTGYNVPAEAERILNANRALANAAIAAGFKADPNSKYTYDEQLAFALVASGVVQSSILTNVIAIVGGGKTLTLLTAKVAPVFEFALNQSEARVLDDVTLRATDRQAATFRAGSKYPIVTSTYSSGITSLPAGVGNQTINGVPVSSLLSQLKGATIPQVTFEDLGLTLKLTPTTQKSDNVRLQLDLKIEALSGEVANSNPILSSRAMVTDVTVHDGDTVLVTSLVTKTESGAVSGVPGVSELPGLQGTTDKDTNGEKDELVILITPRVVRKRRGNWVGPRVTVTGHTTSN